MDPAKTSRGQSIRPVPPIRAGYVMIARIIRDSDIWAGPAWCLKLWLWMLLEASHKSTRKMARGQFRTTTQDLREAATYYAGARPIRPSKWQIAKLLRSLREATMIRTAKTTRGLRITIVQYERYQDPRNYETTPEVPATQRNKAARNEKRTGQPRSNGRPHGETTEPKTQNGSAEQSLRQPASDEPTREIIPTQARRNETPTTIDKNGKNDKKDKKETTTTARVLWNGSKFAIPPAVLKQWQAAYPNIDVGENIKRAAQWRIDHPDKQYKSDRGFLGGWLGREARKLEAAAQEMPPGFTAPRIPTQEERDWITGRAEAP